MGPLLRRRVPYVPQMQLAECGAACLSMVLGYHGHHIALAEAREACSVSRDGASAHSIAKAAEARGLAVRALRVTDPEALAAVRLPAIVHLRDRHFVVVERIARGQADVVDPAQGRRREPLAELCPSSSGVVLTFAPAADFRRRRRPQASRAIYVGAVRHHAPTTAMIVAASLTLELLAVVFPSASQVLVDFVIRPKQDTWLWILGGVLLLATALRLALLALRDRVMHALNQLLDLRFMTSFVDRLLRLPLSFFHHRTTGDLMDRVAANLELRGLSTRIVRTCMDALVVIPYGALMLAYDVKLGLVVLGLTGLRIGAVTALQRRGKDAALLEQTRKGRESSALVQTFGSAELTKLHGARDFFYERYAGRLGARLESGVHRRKLTEGIGQLTIVIEGMTQGLALWIAGRELFADRITVGVFAAFLTIGALIQRPLESLVGTLMQLGRLRSLLARTDDVFEAPVEPSGTKDPGVLQGRIALRHVTFRYGEQSPDVVDDVSFEVERGEKIAIVGPSGSGKSTLARLMVGLLMPRRGTVQLDGVDLRELDLERVRRQMGIVTQETFLFDDTIANNLRLKDDELPLDLIRTAATHACIDDVIEALPRGYDTVVGAHGHRLSGGQRQRLALARALAAEPSILLLDEATSSLDLATEARVHQHLGAFACTRIVIAHRLATVRDADRILVLEHGKIVQQGSYAELAARPGLFRSLIETMEQAA